MNMVGTLHPHTFEDTTSLHSLSTPSSSSPSSHIFLRWILERLYFSFKLLAYFFIFIIIITLLIPLAHSYKTNSKTHKSFRKLNPSTFFTTHPLLPISPSPLETVLSTTTAHSPQLTTFHLTTIANPPPTPPLPPPSPSPPTSSATSNQKTKPTLSKTNSPPIQFKNNLVTMTTAKPFSYPPHHSPPPFTTKSKRLPQAIIVGVKKGGTRALLEFLKFHPQVEICKKEAHFFDTFHSMGLDWYRSRMPLTSKEQITIEKTPAYFVTRAVPGRIRKTLPDAKLIFILRNPVTRVISDYTQLQARKPFNLLFHQLAFLDPPPPSDVGNGGGGDGDDDEDSDDGNDGGEQTHGRDKSDDDDSKKKVNFSKTKRIKTLSKEDFFSNSTPIASVPPSLENLLRHAERGYLEVNQGWTPIRISLYHHHVSRWFKHFPRHQMLFMDGDMLIKNPYESLKRVERFLELEPFYRERHFFQSLKKGFPCMLLRDHEIKPVSGSMESLRDVDSSKRHGAVQKLKFPKNFEKFNESHKQNKTGHFGLQDVGDDKGLAIENKKKERTKFLNELSSYKGGKAVISKEIKKKIAEHANERMWDGGRNAGTKYVVENNVDCPLEFKQLHPLTFIQQHQSSISRYKSISIKEQTYFQKKQHKLKKRQQPQQSQQQPPQQQQQLNNTTKHHRKCLGKNKGRKHPSIHPTLLASLHSFFQPYNKQLFQLIDAQFDWSS